MILQHIPVEIEIDEHPDKQNGENTQQHHIQHWQVLPQLPGFFRECNRNCQYRCSHNHLHKIAWSELNHYRGNCVTQELAGFIENRSKSVQIPVNTFYFYFLFMLFHISPLLLCFESLTPELALSKYNEDPELNQT